MRTPSPDQKEILIVDDTQANLLVLSQMLSEQGDRKSTRLNSSHYS